jgi:DNA-binding MarR family transcriptional regulator
VSVTEAVLAQYGGLMKALQAERGRRGGDPWLDCPMTMPQLRALTLIAVAHDRGLSSRELAAGLGVGPSAITPLVDRLVERGLVARHEDLHDRRIARLQASPDGQQLVERMHAFQGDLIRDVLEQLDPAELATVSAAFTIMSSGVQRVTDRARLAPAGGSPA